ncbi:sugar phosphate nucleotidyltransferase [Microbacterium sediminis]|uniref:Nucleotidyl transferase n=1 Tax=Microbacterium sediminis TaxID=904291 RepID=A0A1B9NDK2_9MICO|nr:sugar phosphate nucleotidyltransferase [Microbacterium sediminis]OCG74681.1 nucleotidyl transferase [Microbacterium sediminis]QBR74978.1 CBS domain-containing protein [Microbacterium sediminis]
MLNENLQAVLSASTATLIDALGAIDRGAGGLSCLVDDDGRLVAVLTDGDVRRALLGGAALEDPAERFAVRNPHTVPSGTSRASVLDLMKSLRISAVPEIDESGRLRAIHTLSDIVGGRVLPNYAVIMAGGKGTRLGELTKHRPKPLMMVAGRAIIEWVILGLVGDGVRNIFVSVNHMADQIIEHLGDGTALGCRIEYLHETPELPLGTAGSLTLLPPHLTEPGADPIIVLNSDIMVEFSARALLEEHAQSKAKMTIGTKLYQHTVPFGVIEMDEARLITSIVEKPEVAVEVNAAVYCIDPELVRELPVGEPSTMPELAQICLDSDRRVQAWPLTSEWIDVGTPADLARAKGEH